MIAWLARLMSTQILTSPSGLGTTKNRGDPTVWSLWYFFYDPTSQQLIKRPLHFLPHTKWGSTDGFCNRF